MREEREVGVGIKRDIRHQGDSTQMSWPGWSEEDRIRCVEQRLREFIAEEEQGIPRSGGLWPLSKQDVRIWLACRKEKKSEQEIARQQYQGFGYKGSGKRKNQAGISFVRRAIDRVDEFFHLKGDDRPLWLRQYEEQLKEATEIAIVGIRTVYVAEAASAAPLFAKAGRNPNRAHPPRRVRRKQH
jgi:hypothetical protein